MAMFQTPKKSYERIELIRDAASTQSTCRVLLDVIATYVDTDYSVILPYSELLPKCAAKSRSIYNAAKKLKSLNLVDVDRDPRRGNKWTINVALLEAQAAANSPGAQRDDVTEQNDVTESIPDVEIPEPKNPLDALFKARLDESREPIAHRTLVDIRRVCSKAFFEEVVGSIKSLRRRAKCDCLFGCDMPELARGER